MMKQGAKMMEGILCSLLPHAYNSVKENRQIKILHTPFLSNISVYSCSHYHLNAQVMSVFILQNTESNFCSVKCHF